MMESASEPSPQSELSRHFQKTRHGDGSIKLEWSDINYSILVKNTEKSKLCSKVWKKREILRGVSGSVASGQLLAIMGPTGR